MYSTERSRSSTTLAAGKEVCACQNPKSRAERQAEVWRAAPEDGGVTASLVRGSSDAAPKVAETYSSSPAEIVHPSRQESICFTICFERSYNLLPALCVLNKLPIRDGIVSVSLVVGYRAGGG